MTLMLVFPALSAAAPRRESTGSTVARLHWTRVSLEAPASTSGVVGLQASGSYVWIGWGDSQGFATLIDTRTDQQTQVGNAPVSDCDYPYSIVLHAPWLLEACSYSPTPEIERFSLSTHTWSAMPYSPALMQEFNGCIESMNFGCAMSAPVLGRDWVGWIPDCGSKWCIHRRFAPGYTNIVTGAWRATPDGNAAVDLDSPRLTTRPCRPIKVSAGETLSYDGRTAISTSPTGRSLLQRCGSDRRLTAFLIASNSRLVVTAAGLHSLSGIQVATLRRFHARYSLPAGPGCNVHVFTVALTNTSMWAQCGNRVWTASTAPLTRSKR